MVNSSSGGPPAARPPTITSESAPYVPWRTKTKCPLGTSAVWDVKYVHAQFRHEVELLPPSSVCATRSTSKLCLRHSAASALALAAPTPALSAGAVSPPSPWPTRADDRPTSQAPPTQPLPAAPGAQVGTKYLRSPPPPVRTALGTPSARCFVPRPASTRIRTWAPLVCGMLGNERSFVKAASSASRTYEGRARRASL